VFMIKSFQNECSCLSKMVRADENMFCSQVHAVVQHDRVVKITPVVIYTRVYSYKLQFLLCI
jgi:hypothetical protein